MLIYVPNVFVLGWNLLGKKGQKLTKKGKNKRCIPSGIYYNHLLFVLARSIFKLKTQIFLIL